MFSFWDRDKVKNIRYLNDNNKWIFFSYKWVIWDLANLGQFDHINRMITLSLITLSGFYSTKRLSNTYTIFKYAAADLQFTRINNFVTGFTVTFHFRNIVLFATFGTNSNKNVIVITSRRTMMLLHVEYQFFDEKSQ